MNRTFHARVTWYHYLYLMLLGGLAFFLLWDKRILPAAVCMVSLVFLIDRFIHTAYTITNDGRLVVSSGRFSKPKTVWLTEITSVESRKSVNILGFSMLHYVMIGYGNGHYVSLLPLKELEFVHLLLAQKKNIKTNYEL